MQRGLMPQTPIRHNGIRIVSYYSAMEKIGGDFYEIFYMKGGYICVLIGDVSGHGIPAAFITAMTKITFTEATRKYLFPKDIFRYANDQLLNIIHTQDYLTVFMVVISPSFEVFYSNASHPKALVFRNRFNEFEEWDTNGLFIGAVNEANDLYEEKHDMLDFGDRMVLYTDGLLEARNDKGDEFGIERLQEIIRRTKDLPLMDARAEVIAYWYSFTDGELVKDDVTFLILEVEKEYRELLEHKNLGLEYLYQDKRKEAIEEFKLALAIDITNIDLHYLLAKSYFKNGEFAKAADHFVEYINSNAEDADALWMLAESQCRCNRYAEAIETSKRTCQIRPASEQALLVWARALVGMRKTDEAKAILNQVLRINPQNSEAINELKTLS
jgi:sigma-B regulation protein RsbU (phosphoserine phosphatase)